MVPGDFVTPAGAWQYQIYGIVRVGFCPPEGENTYVVEWLDVETSSVDYTAQNWDIKYRWKESWLRQVNL